MKVTAANFRLEPGMKVFYACPDASTIDRLSRRAGEIGVLETTESRLAELFVMPYARSKWGSKLAQKALAQIRGREVNWVTAAQFERQLEEVAATKARLDADAMFRAWNPPTTCTLP